MANDRYDIHLDDKYGHSTSRPKPRRTSRGSAIARTSSSSCSRGDSCSGRRRLQLERFHRYESGRRLGASLNVDLTPAYSFGGVNLPAGFQFGSIAGMSFEIF